MKLITKELRDKLVANYMATLSEQNNGNKEPDHVPVVKLFTPDAQATWFLTELNPDDEIMFGLCDLGLGTPELGYVSLNELKEVRGPLNLPIERDMHFDPDNRPLSWFVKRSKRG